MICANAACGKTFSPKTHNQKYCSDVCCREATNARLMEQYYERRDRRQGRPRVCTNKNCSTMLSRYNDKKICAKCEAEQKAEQRAALTRMLNGSE